MTKRKKNYFTIKEIAKVLDIHERSVNRYIKSGKLHAIKIGRWRITKKDLKDFLKQSSNTNK